MRNLSKSIETIGALVWGVQAILRCRNMSMFSESSLSAHSKKQIDMAK